MIAETPQLEKSIVVEIRNNVLQENGRAMPEKVGLTASFFDCDNSIINQEQNFITSRKFLAESITNPSRLSFFLNGSVKLQNVYAELDFQNQEVLKTAFSLLQICANYRLFDTKISRSGEGEILFYREEGSAFKNILIDEDGDVQFMYIPASKANKPISRFFAKEDGLNLAQIIALIQ